MDIILENKIAEAYFLKNMVERIKQLLCSNQKKRNKFHRTIDCHGSNYLEPSCIIQKLGPDYNISDFMPAGSHESLSYYLCKKHDGVYLPLKQAFYEFRLEYFYALIVSFPEGIALFKEEARNDTAYLLKPRTGIDF